LKERLNPIFNPARKLNTCMVGTRQKLLKDVCDWAFESQSNFAWICGIAGTGKSAVAVTLADRFRSMQNEVTLALTFHCVKGQETSNLSLLVPTMCYQLAKIYSGYQKALVDVFNKDQSLNGSGLPVHEQIKIFWDASLFKEVSNKKVIIIIDGLDEWGTESDQEILIKGITSLISQVQGLVIIITSRPLNMKKMTETVGKVRKFDLTSSYNANADIKLLVKKSLETIDDMDKIDKLVHKAGGLFIWITVALKFIKDSMDEEEAIVRVIDSEEDDRCVDNPYRGLDELYKVVLENHFGGNTNVHYFKEVIGVILAAMEPIPVLVLEQMLNIKKIKPGTVKKVLSNMKAVVFERDGKLYYHLSFAEFLGSQERSGRWVVKQGSTHLQLTKACLDILEKELKFNICYLETSCTTNKRVTNPSVQEKVTQYVSAGLQYSCLYWTHHLIEAQECGTMKDCVLKFMTSKRVIYWMECLSLMSRVDCIMSGAKNIKNWGNANKISSASKVGEDIQRFMESFSMIIAESTPHLYISALLLSTRQSLLTELGEKHLKNSVSIKKLYTMTRPMNCTKVFREQNLILAIAYSPDGRHVASGSDDCTVRIWDTQTGKQVSQPLQGHTDWATSVAYSPDGRYVASGSDHTVRIWDTQTGEQVGQPLHGHTGWTTSVAYSPDGRFVASGSDDCTVRIWNTQTGEQIGQPFQGHTDLVTSVVYSPDGRHVASGSDDHTVRIWDTQTGEQVGQPFQGHTDRVRSVTYSPDGRHVASGSDDHTIRLWDTQTCEQIGQPFRGHKDWVRSVAYSPDGKYVASGSDDHTVIIWDTWTGVQVGQPLQGHIGWVISVAYSPDGWHVASGSLDHTVRIWDTQPGEQVGQSFQGHTDQIRSVAYSPDGRYVASGSDDHTVRIWDTETGKQVSQPLQSHTDWVRSVAYSPDGRYVASGSFDCTVRVWDTQAGDELGQPLQGHTDQVRSVAYSPDGKHVVSGSKDHTSLDHTVRIWDTLTGGQVGQPFQGHAYWVRSVAYSPDGRFVASGSDDCTVRIWDTQTGEQVGQPLQGHTDLVTSVAYSPNGRYVASGSNDHTIRIWDTQTGEQIAQPLQGHTDWVRSVTYSPDGKHVASGSKDHTIRIWDIHNGEQVSQPLQGHIDLVTSVAYSPNGRFVASGSRDHTVRIWD
ncbi:WD40 repeat-like protein, partial [Dendrothele bispora CBS 962.96]